MKKLISILLLSISLVSCGGGGSDPAAPTPVDPLKYLTTLNNCDYITTVVGSTPLIVNISRCVNDVTLSTELLITLEKGEELVFKHKNGVTPSMDIYLKVPVT